MTMNYIDQLREWWDTAEQGVARVEDVVIERCDDAPPGYIVFTSIRDEARDYPDLRILSRAKPAWHDAVAVRARWEDPHTSESEPLHGVDTFVNVGDGYWIGGYDKPRPTAELRDVTPLIEARVTDGMVETAQDVLAQRTGQTLSRHAILLALHAALGLDPDTK